jgi:hypothetical protein
MTMPDLDLPPHVRLLKALEPIVYIGNEPGTVVHRQFVNDAELESLSTPYVAIIPGPLAVKRKAAGGGEVSTEVTCTIFFQLVHRIGAAAVPRVVDDALATVWANMSRIRRSKFPGLNARFLQDSVTQSEAYSEPRLRMLGVFDARFSATWVVTENYEVA